MRELTESFDTIFFKTHQQQRLTGRLGPEFPHDQYTIYLGLSELFAQKICLAYLERLVYVHISF